MDVADIIAGTRCIEVATVAGLRIPVRALSELERDDARRVARDVIEMMLPGAAPPDGLLDRIWCRFIIARSALDPEAFLDGERRPLFTPSRVGQLSADDGSELLRAQMAAQARAFGADPSEVRSALLIEAREVRQCASGDRETSDRLHELVLRFLHPTHSSPSSFFGTPERELTFHQLFFHMELHR